MAFQVGIGPIPNGKQQVKRTEHMYLKEISLQVGRGYGW
ncbi:hypothetical protein VD0002_g4408 [Verticillium dahliae]|uniref:Uncharacterized protein n=1 Tax=Verticillium dahliae TaxID=27337 RepID=A0AA44WQY4_VERDA|nr:hypothetical protein BJF96_g1539 [Verticillium dahliae]PNH36972.1 hypothetical protein VD0004_g9798 [Verticillium dahliae]PNH51121.1 hypothetical protein VD0003_g6093 [Verticillium dahliae]PNH64184.1 hypothetical protein VD0002_g4408 [Verticillium dahliae]PNH72444.1 hypothetical protein VD0001_g5127 [Verticillium dahliae]